MIGMRIDQVKGAFFDSEKVLAATSAAERKWMSRLGAYVRTKARSSIRRRKKAAAPGQPPTNRTGLLKRFIFFAYEPDRHSVVIGPAKLNQRIGNAPEVLEHGGRSAVVTGNRRNRRRRTVTIEARPYMGPAFEAERGKLPALIKDVVR